MAKGYWIVHVDVTDPDRFSDYAAANALPLRNFGARFLVRGGRFETPEGEARSRNTIVEFPSYQAALDCYHSAEYQKTVAIRQPAATMDLVIVEGYEGPQPF